MGGAPTVQVDMLQPLVVLGALNVRPEAFVVSRHWKGSGVALELTTPIPVHIAVSIEALAMLAVVTALVHLV